MNTTIEAMSSPAAVRATYCDLASGRTTTSLSISSGESARMTRQTAAQR